MEEADSQLAQELDRRERAALKLQEQRDFERLQVCINKYPFALNDYVCDCEISLNG